MAEKAFILIPRRKDKAMKFGKAKARARACARALAKGRRVRGFAPAAAPYDEFRVQVLGGPHNRFRQFIATTESLWPIAASDAPWYGVERNLDNRPARPHAHC